MKKLRLVSWNKIALYKIIYMRKLSERTYEKHSHQKGDIYGRLTLTGKNYLRFMYGQRRRIVEADCECGGETRWYLFESLAKGETRSCGCLRVDVARERMTTHGLSGHPLFTIWAAMKKRCYDNHCPAFKDYGGRGITMCTEWLNDFESFYVWAMANGWKKGRDLDRQKNNGNYEPGNCRFITRRESNRNTRRNKIITAFGETKCLFDWAKDPRCLIGCWGLRARYDSGKWTDMEKMISTPEIKEKEAGRNKKNNTMLTAFGETKCMSAWLEDKRCVVKIWGLMDRLKSGMDHQTALTKKGKINQFSKVA